jgi:hypothetical protein
MGLAAVSPMSRTPGKSCLQEHEFDSVEPLIPRKTFSVRNIPKDLRRTRCRRLHDAKHSPSVRWRAQ